jgi:hypothetical protein
LLGTVFVAKAIGFVVPFQRGRCERVVDFTSVVGAEEKFPGLESDANVCL